MKAKIARKNIVEGIVGFSVEESTEMAYLILESKFNVSKTDILLDVEIENFDIETIKQILERINQKEPIQYILNNAWFRGKQFYVDNNVLIPRPETEEIIDLIKQNNPTKILDLGTGSGCIAISCASELPDCEVFAIDISEGALRVAIKNAENIGVDVNFKIGDILDFKNPFEQGVFDLIVSNPPYVKMDEKPQMNENVLNFEPHLALFVPDQDPLKYYKEIASIAKKHLASHGYLMVEINAALGNETANLFENMGFKSTKIIQDFYERDRFVIAKGF